MNTILLKTYKDHLIEIRRVNPDRLDVWIAPPGEAGKWERFAMLKADVDFALSCAQQFVDLCMMPVAA